MACVQWVRQPQFPATLRHTARTYMCWMPAMIDVGEKFVLAAKLPPIARRVAATDVHASFQEWHGDNWQRYWKAWKGNFGFGAIVDSGLPTSTAFYPATAVWCVDLEPYVANYWLFPPYPPGCNCQLYGGYS